MTTKKIKTVKEVKDGNDAFKLGVYQALNDIPKLESKNLQSWDNEMYSAYVCGYDETVLNKDFLNTIPSMSFSPKMLTIEQLKDLMSTHKTFNISNKIDNIEKIVCREFETMQTLATIAYDLKAFKGLHVDTINNYHSKALILFINTTKYQGNIAIICNGADLYEVWNIDKESTTKVLDNIDCFNIQKELIKCYGHTEKDEKLFDAMIKYYENLIIEGYTVKDNKMYSPTNQLISDEKIILKNYDGFIDVYELLLPSLRERKLIK